MNQSRAAWYEPGPCMGLDICLNKSYLQHRKSNRSKNFTADNGLDDSRNRRQEDPAPKEVDITKEMVRSEIFDKNNAGDIYRSESQNPSRPAKTVENIGGH